MIQSLITMDFRLVHTSFLFVDDLYKEKYLQVENGLWVGLNFWFIIFIQGLICILGQLIECFNQSFAGLTFAMPL